MTIYTHPVATGAILAAAVIGLALVCCIALLTLWPILTAN